jgi:hypothetical protein
LNSARAEVKAEVSDHNHHCHFPGRFLCNCLEFRRHRDVPNVSSICNRKVPGRYIRTKRRVAALPAAWDSKALQMYIIFIIMKSQ